MPEETGADLPVSEDSLTSTTYPSQDGFWRLARKQQTGVKTFGSTITPSFFLSWLLLLDASSELIGAVGRK